MNDTDKAILILVVWLALLAAGLVVAGRREARVEQERCRQLYAMATTPRDSLLVVSAASACAQHLTRETQ